MHVVTKTVEELSETEYLWCFNANLGIRGQMQSTFRWYRENPDAAQEDSVRVFMLMDERFTTYRRMAAWAMLFDESVYFWTKPHNRNKGYGTTLMKEVKQFKARPAVYPWTDESGGFFSKFEVENGYGSWATVYLTDKPKVC